MAHVDLVYVTMENSQTDRCHSTDSNLQSPPCWGQPDEREGQTNPLAMEAEYCEGHSKATRRGLQEEMVGPPLSSAGALSLMSEVEVICHPSLLQENKARDQKKACCCESETSFTCVDENVNNLDHKRSTAHQSCSHNPDLQPDPCGEMTLEWPYDPASLASEEDDEASSEAAGGKSIDYGFVSAIVFLVTGILLVIISYVIPRDVTVDPSTVAAREMERLENESARIGAHLDRCVIAGLCLLTLGGVVLSSLLMMSMWKGELYRSHRFAASKESARLYGSFNFRVKSSPNDNMELSLVEEDTLAIDS